MRISVFRALILLAASAVCACSRQPGLFNDANANAHISMLAGTIGSRPVGSPANARAREYVVDQLKQIGFQVRVQETDARRHELGRTARVSNIIGIRTISPVWRSSPRVFAYISGQTMHACATAAANEHTAVSRITPNFLSAKFTRDCEH